LERSKRWFRDMYEVKKGCCCCSVGQVSVQAWVQISWKTPFHSPALNGITLCIPFGRLLPQNLPASHFLIVKVILQVLLTWHSRETSTVVALNLGETACCSAYRAKSIQRESKSVRVRGGGGGHVIGLTEIFAWVVI